MSFTVYLDNSATTIPCEAAIKAINNALCECWGNPSSLHEMGFAAEMLLKDARNTVAKSLGARSDEIFFNSCGTEGDNTAIIGAANALKKRGNRIVTTAVEHPAVLRTMEKLSDEGFDVVYIKPDANGNIGIGKFEKAITKDTVLVSTMLVNNEVGAIFPVGEIKRIITEKNSPALLHTDAVQAFGKLTLDVNRLGVDLLTLSGHKIHGPKGIGALYIRSGVHIKPLIIGGGQENGMRSGTESVPLICGLAAAVKELPNPKKQLEETAKLRDYALKILCDTGLVTVNSPENALPYILNISVLGYRSETLLHFLENAGVYVSSGSACSKGKGSFVLNEMGLSPERIDSALRISFSRYNTRADVEALRDAIVSAANRLRRSN